MTMLLLLKLIKGDHFTSSCLSIANELYLLLPIAIHHGPLGRSAPYCTPPLTQSHTWQHSEWVLPQDRTCTFFSGRKCSHHRTSAQVL